MDISHILIAGFTVLIGVVGFFLSKFYNQVERVLNDVAEIKLHQAQNTVRLDTFEKQLDFLRQFITPNEMERHYKQP